MIYLARRQRTCPTCAAVNVHDSPKTQGVAHGHSSPRHIESQNGDGIASFGNSINVTRSHCSESVIEHSGGGKVHFSSGELIDRLAPIRDRPSIQRHDDLLERSRDQYLCCRDRAQAPVERVNTANSTFGQTSALSCSRWRVAFVHSHGDGRKELTTSTPDRAMNVSGWTMPTISHEPSESVQTLIMS